MVQQVDTVAKRLSHGSLRPNTLGVGAIVFFVVSAAGPLVAMAGGVPVAMLLGNGAGISGTFAVTTVLLIIFSAGYTAMSRYVKNAGAFYAFAARGLGKYAAGATGMIVLLSYNTIQIGLYGLFGVAASSLVGSYIDVLLPWWFYSFGAMAVVAALGYRRVDLSVKVLAPLVIAEYLIILVLDIAILGSDTGNGISLRPFSPDLMMSGAPWIGLLFSFTAFIGFEATTIYGEEAKNPDKTIPVATYVSLLMIGGFYMFSSWCVVNGVGLDNLIPTLHALTDPTVLLFSVSDRYVGQGYSAAMRLLFVTSVFATLLAFHNAIARYLFALGRDKILPEALGRTHLVHQSPYVGSWIQSVTALAVVLLFVAMEADPILDLFSVFSALGTLGILCLMVITSASVFMFFRKHEAGSLWRTAILPVIGGVGLIGVAILGCMHFEVLSGTGALWVRLLPATLVLAALAGLLCAAKLQRIEGSF